jgi:hypothetical protein
MFGVALRFPLAMLSPMAQVHGIDISRIGLLELIPFGVCFAHISTLLGFLSTRPHSDESIDDAMRLIKEGNFSDTERRALYRKLVETVLKNVALSPKVQQEMHQAYKRETARIKKSIDPDDQGLA